MTERVQKSHGRKAMAFFVSSLCSTAKEAEEAGMGKAQRQKQDDEGKEDADEDVQLVDGEGEFIVHLLLGVDKARIAVVQQLLFAALLFRLGGLSGGKGRLFLFQLGFAGSEGSFAAGQLFRAVLIILLFFSLIISQQNLSVTFGDTSPNRRGKKKWAVHGSRRQPTRLLLSLTSSPDTCGYRWRQPR